jgi:tripartite-type tricarboxylate transporter receptor subunit TctC
MGAMNAPAFALSMTDVMSMALPVAAQPDRYTDKPIRMVVPFTPGGSNDLVGRVLAQKFSESWGRPVIIDNRDGGGSTLGIEMVVRAAPDGYTLLVTSGGIRSTRPFIDCRSTRSKTWRRWRCWRRCPTC